MRQVPALPPGYNYVRYNSRIYVKYPKTEQVDQRLPGYWYKDENAAKAAWKHYSEERERLRKAVVNGGNKQ